MTLGCNNMGIRKSEFVAKTQFLWWGMQETGVYSDTQQTMYIGKYIVTRGLDVVTKQMVLLETY